MTPSPVPRVAYSCAEFGALFGRSKHWTYGLIRRGQLRALRGYGDLLVPVAEVQRLQQEAEVIVEPRAEGRGSDASPDAVHDPGSAAELSGKI